MNGDTRTGHRIGELLSIGLHNTGKVSAEAWATLLKVRSDRETAELLEDVLEGADLEIVVDHKNQWFTLMPRSKDSVFRMRGEDVRAKLKDGGKQAFFAYAIMAVIATFYPSRFALNNRQHSDIRPETVYATIDKMAEYVEVRRQYQKDDADLQMIAVATEFSEMQRIKDGKGLHPNFQEFYVLAALKTLADEKWIKEEKSGYQPRDRFANMIASRLQKDSFAMSALLKQYFDHFEE
jgi:hypothetical protein